MIGQKELLSKINLNDLPRFMIFSGARGCGKTLLAKEIANKNNMLFVEVDNKIDSIRDMINLVNTNDEQLLLFIKDGNKMSLGAQNSLLKTTEETPNNAFIVLSVENKDLLLPTIISRGETFIFSEYKEEDYKQFILENDLPNTDLILSEIYPNLSYLNNDNIKNALNVRDLCDKVSNKIRFASGINSLKILESIKIKDLENGMNIETFIFCLNKVCTKNLKKAIEEGNKVEIKYQVSYLELINKINKALTNNLFNKQYIMDLFIIKLNSIKF